MKPEVIITFIIFLVVYIVFMWYKRSAKRSLSRQLSEASVNNDKEAFQRVLGSRSASLFLTPFEKVRSRIMFSIINNRREDLDQLCDYVLPLKIRKTEKRHLLELMLSYYLERSCQKPCEEIAAALKDVYTKDNNGEALRKELELLMDLYIYGNQDRIPEMEQLIASKSGEQRSVCEQRLAALYMVNGDSKRAKEWLMKARDDTRMKANVDRLLDLYQLR